MRKVNKSVNKLSRKLGNLAANSLLPKNLYEVAMSQKERGGLPRKGSSKKGSLGVIQSW
jgi:hypothetical protein